MPNVAIHTPQGQNAKHGGAFTASTAVRLGPFASARVLEIMATVNCRIAIGDVTVTATANGLLVLAGLPREIGIAKGQYLSAIGDVVSGTIEAHPVNVV